MSTGDRRRLSIKTHSQAANIAELAHSALLAAKGAEASHTHGNGAMNATVRVTARSETRGLEGENLVRGQLLLVESLLLLLQCLDLVLNSDLRRCMGIH